jgi:molecular chaperone GrpE
MTEQNPIPPELEEKLSELEILRQALEEAKNKSAEYYDQLLRLKAEFENFRKRMEKEKVDSRRWAKQEVLMPVIQLADVFEQAMTQGRSAKDLKDVLLGLEFLHKQFGSFLKAEGVEPVESQVGKPLDPEIAEAVDHQEIDDEKKAGIVLAELQKGYRMNGRMIRPSRVRVAVAKKPPEKK